MISLYGPALDEEKLEKYFSVIDSIRLITEGKFLGNNMIKKIVSGFQTGADIAAINAAIDNNIPYGGWIPKGRLTEDGQLPEKYIAQEMPTQDYEKRTEQNVIDSDGTVIFSHGPLTGGSKLTMEYAATHGKPYLHLDMQVLKVGLASRYLAKWISKEDIKVLNVAGKRASQDNEIYAATYSVISLLLSA